jgi:hypothetical protein
MRSEGKSNAGDQAKDRRLESHNGHVDEATTKHNTLSAEVAHVQVFYPFHPLYGYSLRVLQRPKRGEGAVVVLDSAGKRLKIPVWMLLPNAETLKVAEQSRLSKESLLNLTGLFKQWSGSGNSDNLLPPSVDGCKGGHHAAATTVKSQPIRRGSHSRRGDDKSRTGRSHGSHSGDSFPNRIQESE